MSMAVGGKKGGAMADINVTPMADIMIVLLIIFMVITPMLQKGVDVKLPIAGNTKERKDEPKTITVAIKQGRHDLPERHQARQPGGPHAPAQGAARGPARRREGRLPEGRRRAWPTPRS